MSKKIILVLLFFIPLILLSQEGRKIEQVKGDFFTIDIYGDIYIVERSVFYKFNLKGELLFSFANRQLGAISSVNVDNPMKIMLFYQDIGSVIFLNDKLVPITNELNFFEKGYSAVSLSTFSGNNQIYFYDPLYSNLVATDFFLKEVSRVHLTFTPFTPVKIFNIKEKNVIMYDPKTGFYIFDVFCNFVKKLALTTPSDVNIFNEKIYFIENEMLSVYDIKSLELSRISISVKEKLKSGLIYQNKIVVMDDKGTVIIDEL